MNDTSISRSVLAFSCTSCRSRALAATAASSKYRFAVGFLGFSSTPKSAALGRSWCNNSRRFATSRRPSLIGSPAPARGGVAEYRIGGAQSAGGKEQCARRWSAKFLSLIQSDDAWLIVLDYRASQSFLFARLMRATQDTTVPNTGVRRRVGGLS